MTKAKDPEDPKTELLEADPIDERREFILSAAIAVLPEALRESKTTDEAAKLAAKAATALANELDLKSPKKKVAAAGEK